MIYMFLAVIILIVFIVYINSREHMRKACIKVLQQLVYKKKLSKEEFDDIRQKVYSKNVKQEIIQENKQANLQYDSEQRKVVNDKTTSADLEKLTKENKEKIRQNNISVLLYLGVTLIIFAGVIFATTTWDYLPGAIKAVLLFGFSGMLFGASIVAKQKLKVEKTAFALWVLGSIFLPITCICAGYLEIFGNYFSLNSPGKYLFALCSALICLPIYIESVLKYSSKVFAYITVINVTLIAYFSFLNLSNQMDIILVLMGIYNFCIFAICSNIVPKDKYNKMVATSLIDISKITVILTTVVAMVTSFSYEVTMLTLLNYILIIGNYKYICLKQKSYLFSIIASITIISFFNAIYVYLTQNSYLINVEYTSFMFVLMAFVYVLIEFVRGNILINKKWDGLKLFASVMTIVFLPLLAIKSLTGILDLSNDSSYVIVFAIITLLLLIQKRLNYKNKELVIANILDVFISIFSILVAFTLYRYLPISMQINNVLYISIICFIPWIISKLMKNVNNLEKNNTYRFVGTVFLIIPFILSFVEIDKDMSIYRFLVAISIMLLNFVNYIDYLKIIKKDKDKIENKDYNSDLKTSLLNISYISAVAPIFVFLTSWLPQVPTYFTTYISAGIVYGICMLDNSNKLFEKSKIYILVMIILSNLFMLFNIVGIFEYIFMQAILLILYFNKTLKKSTFYNIYILIALVVNTLTLNLIVDTNSRIYPTSSINMISSDIFNLINISVFLIITIINIYNYYELKLLKNSNESSYNKNINVQKFIISFGILISIIPYTQTLNYISQLLNVPDVLNSILIQLAIIFTVFSIEKLIYKVKNIFTYIIQIVIYYIAMITLYEFNDILIYSTMLLILVIIGSAIKNKSMFLIPAIFLVIFVVKGTMEFWLSIPWWLYLLIGGITLVYVAMLRESNKQKESTTVKKNILRKFISKLED